MDSILSVDDESILSDDNDNFIEAMERNGSTEELAKLLLRVETYLGLEEQDSSESDIKSVHIILNSTPSSIEIQDYFTLKTVSCAMKDQDISDSVDRKAGLCPAERSGFPLRADLSPHNCNIVNMFKIWKYLVPFLGSKPIKKVIKIMFDAEFTYRSTKEGGTGRLSYHETKSWFRGTLEEYQDIITHPNPWTKYPFVTFSDYIGTEHDLEFIVARDNYKTIKEKALKEGINSIWWYIYPGGCYAYNGGLLFYLLTRAFPNKRFKVVKSRIHTTIIDEKDQIYDLF